MITSMVSYCIPSSFQIPPSVQLTPTAQHCLFTNPLVLARSGQFKLVRGFRRVLDDWHAQERPVVFFDPSSTAALRLTSMAIPQRRCPSGMLLCHLVGVHHAQAVSTDQLQDSACNCRRLKDRRLPGMQFEPSLKRCHQPTTRQSRRGLPSFLGGGWIDDRAFATESLWQDARLAAGDY